MQWTIATAHDHDCSHDLKALTLIRPSLSPANTLHAVHRRAPICRIRYVPADHSYIADPTNRVLLHVKMDLHQAWMICALAAHAYSLKYF